MSTTRILYTRTPTLAAALIRAMPPWGPWSHCAVLGPDGQTAVECLALEGGVVRTDRSSVIRRSSAWVEVEVDTPAPIAGWRWALGTVGRRYDWGGVWGIPSRRRGANHPDRWYCSEHVAQALASAGRQVADPAAHGLTPNHVFTLTFAAGHRVLAGH